MAEPLIRWEKDPFASSGYLGEWYVFTIVELSTACVLRSFLPNTPDGARQSFGTRRSAQAHAETLVQGFLAFAQLPGRI